MRSEVDRKIWGSMVVSFLIHFFLILAFNRIPFSLEKGEKNKRDVMINIEIIGDEHRAGHTNVRKKGMNMRILQVREGLKKEAIGNSVREGIIESGEKHGPLKVESGNGREFEIYSFDNGYGEDFLTQSGDNGDTEYDGGSIEGSGSPSNEKYLLEEIRRRILSAIIYPESSRKMGHEGRVRLSFHIDNNGRVTGYKIISSSGWNELDRSVISALLSVKEYPPYDGWIILPVEFRLR